MSIKKCITGIATVVLCGASLASYATPLTIVNNTQNDSTTRIHNILNKCSSELLGEAGITRAGQTNVVSENNIRAACFFTPNSCVADVYATANCSGDIIATIEFSTTDGIKSVVPRSSKYKITAQAFHVVLDQLA